MRHGRTAQGSPWLRIAVAVFVVALFGVMVRSASERTKDGARSSIAQDKDASGDNASGVAGSSASGDVERGESAGDRSQLTGDDCDKDFGTPDDAGTKNLSQITQGLVDHAGTTTFECAGDVEHVARELLMSYRDQGNCVLAYADYLDLRGRVWGCLVQGGAWVDVCLVEEQEEGERCCVRVLRIEAQEMAQLLAEDGDEPYGNERE